MRIKRSGNNMYFKDLLIELQATNQWQEAIPEWPNAPKSCDIYIKLHWEYVIDQRFQESRKIILTFYNNVNPFGYEKFLGPYFQVLWEGVKQIILLIGAFATKCFERSRIFRYGLIKDI